MPGDHQVDGPEAVQQVLELWNKFADRHRSPRIPRIILITGKRETETKRMLRDVDGPAGFGGLLVKFETADPWWHGKGRKWPATFDWFIKEENRIKLMEGAFEANQADDFAQSRGSPRRKTTHEHIDDALDRTVQELNRRGIH